MTKYQGPKPANLQKTMVEAAHAAGLVLSQHFQKKLNVREKKGAGLVTQVDLNAEYTAIRILKKSFPNFGFLTEETSPHATSNTSGRWIIDPLDGTTNYVHGFPMFCVSIAAEWENETIAGVIYHPILKDTYVALKGRGSSLNGKKIRVSKTSTLHNSLLTTGFTYRKDKWLHKEMESFERLSKEVRAVRRPGSAALDLAYTARGVFDGFWERRLSPWDIAAGALLVQEAGGTVTNFKGEKLLVTSPEILASNGLLHRKMRQKISTP